jgi:hypothetical protein
MDWKGETFRATVVLLAASAVLIGPGVAGIGSSFVLAGTLVALAALLFAGSGALGAAPRAVGHEVGDYGAVLWVAPLVAAAVVLLALDATPGELQALGGLVGLAGMANYFLRPLYRLGYAALRTVGVVR